MLIHYKTDFSECLKTAIRLAGLDELSNAGLANRFNLRHPNQPVSTQAFHHWLVGRSIPTLDKIETPAKWLDTSAEWLRHGRLSGTEGAAPPQESLLLKYFRLLPPEKRNALMVLLHNPDDG
ncbi:TPA: transcriptional regulator [Neisseria gonorrhoeae]